MEMATGEQKSIEKPPETEKEVRNGDCEFSNTLHLPHDIIIYDILTRVPIDSLMRFRCVCKLWSSSIINNTKFIKSHSSRTYSDRGFIWISDNCTENDDVDSEVGAVDTNVKSNCIVFYDIDKKENKVFQFRPESGLVNKKRLEILDSLNGMLLLGCYDQDGELETHHVYNPITGCSIQLPNLEDTTPIKNKNMYYLGLAYDSIMGKYKVIGVGFSYWIQRGGIDYLEDRYECPFKMITLGVESDTWRDLVVPELYPRLHNNYDPMFACGSLYWLTHPRYVNVSNYSSDDQRILAFDVSRETFYTIKYPKGALNDCKLLEMDESLCFLDYVPPGKLKLWVLKEDEEKKNDQHQEYEWAEKYNVDHMPSLSGSEPPSNVDDTDNCYALVTNPTVKILFLTYSEPEEAQVCYDLRSYDLQLRRLDSIFKVKKLIPHQWHLNCLANF